LSEIRLGIKTKELHLSEREGEGWKARNRTLGKDQKKKKIIGVNRKGKWQ
jgi:hypothetical protein